MKVPLAAIALFIAIVCFANMASPIRYGTKNIAPVTSRNIDITHELLSVTVDSGFQTATFSIYYYINTDTTGIQVPLMFAAAGSAKDMRITIDDKLVYLQGIPSSYTTTSSLPFRGFDGLLSLIGQDRVAVTWDKNSTEYYFLPELQFFEADLTKGPHVIHVQYTAQIEINRSNWVNKYNCNYYLSPARHWKSFGGLDIVLDKRNFTKPLNTNLGKPVEDAGTITKWYFGSIPADVLQITYNPKAGAFAAALIAISPLGLAVIAGIILLALQVWLMMKYRYHKLIYRLVYYTGTFAVPIIFYACYFSAFDLIDAVIGDEAAALHGYTFIFGFSYILVAPAYAGIAYLINDKIKRKIAAKYSETFN